MTTGVLIFAFNNEHVDYLAMANWSAGRIRHHLDLPVCVVTDVPVPDHYVFEKTVTVAAKGSDTRDFHDIDGRVTWYNGNRADAYALSPWDCTLVLDADYVVSSSVLTQLINTDVEFVAHKTAYDVTGTMNFDDHNTFGRNLMPMWWATVMLFKRCRHAELIFSSMQMIKHNWNHYRNLYGIAQATYRNDYALSMALGMVNGHVLTHPDIPWKLATVTHHHTLKQIDQDNFRVEFLNQNGRPQWTRVSGDFHAMGKRHLGDIIAANP